MRGDHSFTLYFRHEISILTTARYALALMLIGAITVRSAVADIFKRFDENGQTIFPFVSCEQTKTAEPELEKMKKLEGTQQQLVEIESPT